MLNKLIIIGYRNFVYGNGSHSKFQYYLAVLVAFVIHFPWVYVGAFLTIMSMQNIKPPSQKVMPYAIAAYFCLLLAWWTLSKTKVSSFETVKKILASELKPRNVYLVYLYIIFLLVLPLIILGIAQ